MILAKNNILVPLVQKGTQQTEYAILNPISGSFDLMGTDDYTLYEETKKGRFPDPEFQEYLLERGYLYPDQNTHDTAVAAAYEEFQREMEQAQIQLILIPTYSCNLDCVYCFQHGIDGKPTLISKETVDAFFDTIREEFKDASRKPFITLFGGEPLMNSPAQRSMIQYIIDQCIAEDYELTAVTNGYDFVEFVPMLKKAKIKEIQFTLDGTKEVHDQRRYTANKRGTFDRILAGMEEAILAGMPINLRTVTDKENIADLVPLAQLLEEKGWLDLPPEKFKTQIGRNYELFECYEKPQHLFTQVELWATVASMAKVHPVLAKFHRPDFLGIRYLVETGDLYLASFDTCPAAKTEWVYDLYGDIYGCTASCGREEFKLGTFWPKKTKNQKLIQDWKTRNVTNIAKCRDCSYDVICGGGCGVMAANQNGGKIHSPDCRPVQELYEIGINFYAEEIKDLTESEPEPSFPGETDRLQHGCMVCGADLMYEQSNREMICQICGKTHQSRIQCSHGHNVCDECHKSDLLDQIYQIFLRSRETDPVKLANRMFQLPFLNMHGPEYHSLVPGILVTAYQNLCGIRDGAEIKEAMERGKQVLGGSCGYLGNCGACVGIGIAESVLLKATPVSREERGKANLATAHALLAVGELQGPQCCKRDAIASIEAYQKLTGRYGTEPLAVYQCSQWDLNQNCIGALCPYYPVEITRDPELVGRNL